MSNWPGPIPCVVCGGPKPKGPGKKYCEPCRDANRSLAARDRAARISQQKAAASLELQRPQAMAKLAPPGQFWCGKCRRYLPQKSRSTQGGKNQNPAIGWCRPCYKVYLLAYRLRKVYGLTLEQYDELMRLQGDACAICLNHPKTMRLAVDHSHHTGEVRGLLCKRCNRDLLGKAGHDPALLRRAADYLEAPPARRVLPEGHVVPPDGAPVKGKP